MKVNLTTCIWSITKTLLTLGGFLMLWGVGYGQTVVPSAGDCPTGVLPGDSCSFIYADTSAPWWYYACGGTCASYSSYCSNDVIQTTEGYYSCSLGGICVDVFGDAPDQNPEQIDCSDPNNYIIQNSNWCLAPVQPACIENAGDPARYANGTFASCTYEFALDGTQCSVDGTDGVCNTWLCTVPDASECAVDTDCPRHHCQEAQCIRWWPYWFSSITLWATFMCVYTDIVDCEDPPTCWLTINDCDDSNPWTNDSLEEASCSCVHTCWFENVECGPNSRWNQSTCACEDEPAVCWDWTASNSEECDEWTNNDVVCSADYDDFCSYCDEDCTIQIAAWPICGDDTRDDPSGVTWSAEECDGTANCDAITCECEQGYVADGGECFEIINCEDPITAWAINWWFDLWFTCEIPDGATPAPWQEYEFFVEYADGTTDTFVQAWSTVSYTSLWISDPVAELNSFECSLTESIVQCSYNIINNPNNPCNDAINWKEYIVFNPNEFDLCVNDPAININIDTAIYPREYNWECVSWPIINACWVTIYPPYAIECLSI